MYFLLVDFICFGRVVPYVWHGWCMPDGAFPFSGVIVNNISCLGIWFKSSNGPASFLSSSGWGLVWIFSLCNFWIASPCGVFASCGVVCLFV